MLLSAIANWVLDFLSSRSQSVKIGKSESNKCIINTGVPQGSVLSPLFTLYTHDCGATLPGCHIF